MFNESFSIQIQENNGLKLWEIDGIPQPNNVLEGMAHYNGQGNVENLLKIINHKVYKDHEERFLDPLYSIFNSSLEQGVGDDGTIQWDDRSHFTRISWTSYTWKLPPEIKRKRVQITISKVGDNNSIGTFIITLRKIADDGGDIQIPAKIISKLNLKNGNSVSVRIRFSH